MKSHNNSVVNIKLGHANLIFRFAEISNLKKGSGAKNIFHIF